MTFPAFIIVRVSITLLLTIIKISNKTKYVNIQDVLFNWIIISCENLKLNPIDPENISF